MDILYNISEFVRYFVVAVIWIVGIRAVWVSERRRKAREAMLLYAAHLLKNGRFDPRIEHMIYPFETLFPLFTRWGKYSAIRDEYLLILKDFMD